MIAWLVTVLYLAPAPAGQPEPQRELQRETTIASSVVACQARAETLAAAQRQIEAETLRRFGGRIVGTCQEQPK